MENVLAVDLGGTRTRVALVAPDGRILAREVFPTPSDGPSLRGRDRCDRRRAQADLGRRSARDRRLGRRAARPRRRVRRLPAEPALRSDRSGRTAGGRVRRAGHPHQRREGRRPRRARVRCREGVPRHGLRHHLDRDRRRRDRWTAGCSWAGAGTRARSGTSRSRHGTGSSAAAATRTTGRATARAGTCRGSTRSRRRPAIRHIRRPRRSSRPLGPTSRRPAGSSRRSRS